MDLVRSQWALFRSFSDDKCRAHRLSSVKLKKVVNKSTSLNASAIPTWLLRYYDGFNMISVVS